MYNYTILDDRFLTATKNDTMDLFPDPWGAVKLGGINLNKVHLWWANYPWLKLTFSTPSQTIWTMKTPWLSCTQGLQNNAARVTPTNRYLSIQVYHQQMVVSGNRGTPKSSRIIHLKGIFPYKPAILYPPFMEIPIWSFHKQPAPGTLLRWLAATNLQAFTWQGAATRFFGGRKWRSEVLKLQLFL